MEGRRRVKSTEETARAAYLELPAVDKMLVNSWRALGNDWFTSVVNSGVLLPYGRRVRPDDAARAAEAERLAEVIAREQARIGCIGEELAFKETAQHEAAHVIVAESFGLKVKLAHILPGGAGKCLYGPAKTPFQTAAIALAGECWISVFRSRVFLSGPTGCEADRRMAIRALPIKMEREKAWRHCWQVLKDNEDTVEAIAERIERDGHYLP